MPPLTLADINPHIRYVNNYRPLYSFREKKRIIYDFELMYVMEGTVEMCYGGIPYPLRKGDLFYLKPHVENFITVKAEQHFRTHCIHFDWLPPAAEEDFTAEEIYMHSSASPDYRERCRLLFKRDCSEPADFSAPSHIQGLSYELFSGLFARCYSHFITPGPVSRLLLTSSFYEIIGELTRACRSDSAANPAHPQILAAMEYVKANYTREFSVPELAARFGLSPKYFGALFKQAAGMPLRQYVLELRLYAAREMLLGSDLPIEAISRKAGFANTFYFSNCFKKAENIPPTEYRRRMR